MTKNNELLRVVILTRTSSGSNCSLFYKYLQTSFSGDWLDYKMVHINNLSEYAEILNQADIIFTDFLPYKFQNSQLCIQFWHGFPLKTLGLMDPVDRNNTDYIKRLSLMDDFVISYSQLYTTLYNACFPHTYEHYKILGMPRNDFLFLNREKSLKFLSLLIGIEIDDLRKKKNIIYVPTYRDIESRKDSVFSTSGIVHSLVSNKSFLKTLDLNDYNLFIKLHPFEAKLEQELAYLRRKNIFFLNDDRLSLNNLDFYEVLPAFDLLITDYSSIYFDWLLIERPVIFYTPDLNYYDENRGFLLEPIYDWMPGPICTTLEEVLSNLNLGPEALKQKFLSEIVRLKNIVHEHHDSNSSERIISFLRQIKDGEIIAPQVRVFYENNRIQLGILKQ